MKIAYFSDNFYPELSGISDSIIALGQALAKRGHEIHYFAPHYSAADYALVNRSDDGLSFGKNIFIHRFRAWPYPAPTKQGRLVIPTIWRWLNLKKHYFDIIHTQLFFGVGLEALAASKRLNIPLVGTSHTPITEFISYTPLKNFSIDNFAWRYVSWYYNHCAYVTAPSRGVLDEMKQNGFYRPCQVVSNPIDIDNFFPVPGAAKQNLKKKFNLSDFTILYTGRLAREKHIDEIIQAVAAIRKKFPQIEFVLTGSGKAKDELKTLVQKLKLENIKFFGFVDEQTQAELYQASDIFVVMSTAETQCLSLMKAMAAALPVVCARARGLAEYVDGRNGLLVEPGDYEVLADKLIYLYSNPAAARQLGKGGQEFVRNFSPEKIARIWEEIYYNIINNNKKVNKNIL